MAVPQSVAPQPLFEQSSQFRNWRFSKSGLETLRQELNQGAVERVKAKLEEERTLSPVKKEDGAQQQPPPPPPSEAVYLTVQDEQNLVKFYLTKVPQLSKAFGFNDAVASTAMSYLKRFYLRNTCMDYHPKIVMLTCLFLATKTENQLISINSFAAKIKSTTPSDILSLEFLVSQSLKFQYKVHHAHLAAYGVFLDLQSVIQDAPIAAFEHIFTKASSLIKASRLTDLEFFFTPSQIALAGFYAVDPGMVDTWLSSKHPSVTNDNSIEHNELVQLLQVIVKHLKDIPEVKPDEVRQVDRKLRFSRNPEKDPTSALYKRKIEQQESSDNAKHAKKARDGALDDPFGPSAPPSTDATPAPTSGVPSVTVKTEPDVVKTEQPVDPM